MVFGANSNLKTSVIRLWILQITFSSCCLRVIGMHAKLRSQFNEFLSYHEDQSSNMMPDMCTGDKAALQEKLPSCKLNF